jgi:hypothetical protein
MVWKNLYKEWYEKMWNPNPGQISRSPAALFLNFLDTAHPVLRSILWSIPLYLPGKVHLPELRPSFCTDLSLSITYDSLAFVNLTWVRCAYCSYAKNPAWQWKRQSQMGTYVKLWAVAKKAETFHCPTHADAPVAQHSNSMMGHFTSPLIVSLWGSWWCEPRLELSTMDRSWTAQHRPGKLVHSDSNRHRDGMWMEQNCWGSVPATVFGGRRLFWGLLWWRGEVDGWSSSRWWLNRRGRREVMGVGAV